MRNYIAPIALCCTLLAAPSAKAATIGIQPLVQNAQIGDIISIDVLVGDLAAGAAPSLGGFDFMLGFDSSILAPLSVTIGPLLGDLAAFEATGGAAAVAEGLNLFEVSFLAPADLDARQPAAFAIASLTFTALRDGTSALDIGQVTLSDGFGSSLPATIANGSVTVESATPVPEPATGVLLLIGLACACRRAKNVLEPRATFGRE